MEESLERIKKFSDLELSKNFYFDKFNRFTIVHYSSTIEDSTLTVKTHLLLEENFTPKGKPLDRCLMASSHYNALLYILEPDKPSTKITPKFTPN